MAEVKTIHVYTRRPSVVGAFMRQVIFWSLLVGAVGTSRVWFGGAWIVDIVAFIVVIVAVLALIRKETGFDVKMTKDELRLWTADGMPDDVKSWKARRNG